MNPLLAATAADAVGKSIESGKAAELVETAFKPFKIMLVLVAVAIVGFFIYKGVKNAIAKGKATQNNNQDIISNPRNESDRESNRKSFARQYATRLRGAFNPSGISWMINTDTTNTKEVFSIADSMKSNGVPFSYVANAYYSSYKDDLAKRLESELSASEINLFYKKAGLNGLSGFSSLFRSPAKPLNLANYAY